MINNKKTENKIFQFNIFFNKIKINIDKINKTNNKFDFLNKKGNFEEKWISLTKLINILIEDYVKNTKNSSRFINNSNNLIKENYKWNEKCKYLEKLNEKNLDNNNFEIENYKNIIQELNYELNLKNEYIDNLKDFNKKDFNKIDYKESIYNIKSNNKLNVDSYDNFKMNKKYIIENNNKKDIIKYKKKIKNLKIKLEFFENNNEKLKKEKQIYENLINKKDNEIKNILKINNKNKIGEYNNQNNLNYYKNKLNDNKVIIKNLKKKLNSAYLKENKFILKEKILELENSKKINIIGEYHNQILSERKLREKLINKKNNYYN